MNTRHLALGLLAVAPLAGCAAEPESPADSAVSFSAIAATGAPPSSSVATGTAHPGADLAGPGTVCGAAAGSTVVVRAGAANCVDALRVAGVYAAAAAHAQGQAVTVDTGGWRCTARVTDQVGTCRSGENTVSVG